MQAAKAVLTIVAPPACCGTEGGEPEATKAAEQVQTSAHSPSPRRGLAEVPQKGDVGFG